MRLKVPRFVLTFIFLAVSSFLFAQNDPPVAHSPQPTDTLTSLDKVMKVFEFKMGRASLNLYPIIAYAPAPGWQFGVMPLVVFPKEDDLADAHRLSSISGSVTYSSNNWFEALANIKVYGKNLDFSALVEGNVLNETFFGIGVPEQSETYSVYKTTYFNMKGYLYRNVRGHFYAGLTYDFNWNKITNIQDSTLNDAVPGVDGGAIVGLGPVLSYDDRDNVDYPSKGQFLFMSMRYYPQLFKQDYEYIDYIIDIRKYIDLKRKFILAFQVYNKITYGNTPFYEMPKLAGRTALRGFEHRSKFIDNNMGYAQVELRKHLFWRLGAVAFAGVGNTYSASRPFNESVKYVFGLGTRFNLITDSKINFRADFGFGSNGDHAVFLTVREAF